MIAETVMGAFGRESFSVCTDLCGIYPLLYHDKLHVQYGNHGTDGSNLSLHRPGHGC